ncbi:MAG: PfkB family carbohydrate kinase [Actinomycetia bacterium]|nr:PfkB family carbohydrate kinase [Actinomycetes bacterium]
MVAPRGVNGAAPGLLVVGDVVTDVVARHGEPLAPHTDTAARIAVTPGGAGANVACWAARCGARVRLLGRVGADSADWHRAALLAAGVEPALRVDPELPTAVVVALVDAAAERTLVTDSGAAFRLGPEDWDDALLDGPWDGSRADHGAWDGSRVDDDRAHDGPLRAGPPALAPLRGPARPPEGRARIGHVHLSGYLFFSAPGRELAAAVREAALARGVPVSVDPASAGFLRRLGIEAFLDAVRGTDLLLPNAAEAALLSGRDEPRDAAAALSSRLGGTVVVTLGAAGALAAERGTVTARVAAPDAAAVDTTGAGDAFTGGLLAARLAGADLPGALAAGCRAGAEAVTVVGGRPPGRRADATGLHHGAPSRSGTPGPGKAAPERRGGEPTGTRL